MAAWGAHCAGCGETVKRTKSSRCQVLKIRQTLGFSHAIMSILCSKSGIRFIQSPRLSLCVSIMQIEPCLYRKQHKYTSRSVGDVVAFQANI